MLTIFYINDTRQSQMMLLVIFSKMDAKIVIMFANKHLNHRFIFRLPRNTYLLLSAELIYNLLYRARGAKPKGHNQEQLSWEKECVQAEELSSTLSTMAF